MKTFAQYLTESSQTYDYRIKIVGDLPADFLSSFKKALGKYDPKSLADVKKTPVMATPFDFPAYSNESVNLMDVTFNYPASLEEVRQIAELHGMSPDRVLLVDREYAEGMDKELLGIEEQNKDLLNTDYPEPNADQKKASKEYSEGNQQVVKNSADEATWTVAGGKTPPAETTNDIPMGVKSPMSDMKRPPKPATGNHPEG